MNPYCVCKLYMPITQSGIDREIRFSSHSQAKLGIISFTSMAHQGERRRQMGGEGCGGYKVGVAVQCVYQLGTHSPIVTR